MQDEMKPCCGTCYWLKDGRCYRWMWLPDKAWVKWCWVAKKEETDKTDEEGKYEGT